QEPGHRGRLRGGIGVRAPSSRRRGSNRRPDIELALALHDAALALPGPREASRRAHAARHPGRPASSDPERVQRPHARSARDRGFGLHRACICTLHARAGHDCEVWYRASEVHRPLRALRSLSLPLPRAQAGCRRAARAGIAAGSADAVEPPRVRRRRRLGDLRYWFLRGDEVMLAVAHREAMGHAPDHPGPSEDAGRWGLPLCVLLALALRLAALFVVGHPEMLRGHLSLSSDEPSFHETAQALAMTGSYSKRPDGPATAFRSPGLILPLAALYYFVQPTPYVAFAYVMLGGLAIVMVPFGLADATCGDRHVAVMAALLAAVSPTLIFTASGIWSEPQAIALTLLLLWQLTRGRTGLGNWALLALCASLAYLTRPSAAFLFPVLVAAALLSGRGWTRVLNATVLVSVLALPIGFWALRNRLTFGDYVVGGAV